MVFLFLKYRFLLKFYHMFQFIFMFLLFFVLRFFRSSWFLSYILYTTTTVIYILFRFIVMTFFNTSLIYCFWRSSWFLLFWIINFFFFYIWSLSRHFERILAFSVFYFPAVALMLWFFILTTMLLLLILIW